MDPREDDDRPFDEYDETDSIIRQLRSEMVRLQAQIDQLMAAAQERAEEAVELRARMDELDRLLQQIQSRYQRRLRRWVWIAAMYGASLGMMFSWLMR